ncbi:amidohydrolase family protein [Clostridium sp. MCC353]|uniref:amidohydrolase family protein n=1 Tax=Clostridium sp. MCC353 TaxID=2592646 RepID=UPI001C027925|nr:amidohydrolase family protein [Clostridium sp. MCC353]MBT9776711.1 amidohydrolase family protein [Clostridium sp. MCC353]
MENNCFVLKGHICYSSDQKTVQIVENGYLVCENGVSAGVYRELPEGFRDYPMTDYGDSLIIPGLVDLHMHAPQYAFRGLGMDLELLDWLNTHTFPEEAKYRDLEYAERAYTIFADNLKNSATTRACIFATIHTPATELLMDLLEETGIKAMVGKVNMDRNSPDILVEETEQSAEDTIRWLEETSKRYQNVKPILTPRFIPTCSDELMERLSEIQKRYNLPLQSHLSENQSEIAWVKELCPQSEFYGDAYDRTGAFGGTYKTIMAHCVWSGEEEQDRMKERGVFAAHCPQSNMNLSSGIAPIRSFLDKGIKVGLGSDIAGGFTESIFRAMSDAIQASKMRWRIQDESLKPLTVEEAFYLGTKGGGEFFGNVGSFEKGYELDAVVLDDSSLKHPQHLGVKERLERLIYLACDSQIKAKYVAGNLIIH